MAANTRRPIFLNLLLMRQPIGAVVSIAHRLSGVLLVLSIPLAVYLLDLSLAGPAGFDRVRAMLGGTYAPPVLFLFAWALLHHLFVGVRFLLIDLAIGASKPAARVSAWTALIGAAAVAVGILVRLL